MATNDKKIIYWQYPNEEQVRIIGADRWQFDENYYYDCNNAYYYFKYRRMTQFTYANNKCQLAGYTPEYTTGGRIGMNAPPFTNFRFYVNQNLYAVCDSPDQFVSPEGEILFRHWSFLPENDDRKCGSPPYGRTKLYQLYCDSASHEDIRLFQSQSSGVEIYDWHLPPNEQAKCKQGCRFTLWSGDEIVYERIEEDGCPSVWEEVKACPPGTCEIKCREKYCCYDETGQAVYSFEL